MYSGSEQVNMFGIAMMFICISVGIILNLIFLVIKLLGILLFSWWWIVGFTPAVVLIFSLIYALVYILSAWIMKAFEK